jgi:hypothetical protein
MSYFIRFNGTSLFAQATSFAVGTNDFDYEFFGAVNTAGSSFPTLLGHGISTGNRIALGTNTVSIFANSVTHTIPMTWAVGEVFHLRIVKAGGFVTVFKDGAQTGQIADTINFTANLSKIAHTNSTYYAMDLRYCKFQSGSFNFFWDARNISSGSTLTDGTGGYHMALTGTPNWVQEPCNITSINGGQSLSPGQSDVAVLTNGFTAKPNQVTVSYNKYTESIGCTIGTGVNGNFVINVADRANNVIWPKVGTILTLTFRNGSELAVMDSVMGLGIGELSIDFIGAITDEPATLTYQIAQDSLDVEGGELVYKPYAGLEITDDGGWTSPYTGTFDAWFRPISGTGAFKVYQYTFTTREDGLGLVPANLLSLLRNATSPYYDGGYPLGNRP